LNCAFIFGWKEKKKGKRKKPDRRAVREGVGAVKDKTRTRQASVEVFGWREKTNRGIHKKGLG